MSVSRMFREWFLSPVFARLDRLELIMATESESRADLDDAITGTLALLDAKIVENDQLRAALESADADAAQRVADAMAANDAGDAEFNEQSAAKLRRTVSEPVDPPVDETAPDA